jgi:ABC-type nitrate/sulfonate/bicarbonate transport system substrate-binding protein
MAGPPNLFGVIIGAPSQIRTVDDLKGKKIGISTVGAVTDWFALELARQKGWGPDGIETVALGTGDAPHIAALKTHQVDALIANSALGFKLEEVHEGRLLIPVGDYVGDCIVHMISASTALIARDPDAVRRFLAGWFDTIAFMRRNKAETVALARVESGFDAAIETREYDLGMPMFSANGIFTDAALANLKNLLARNHVIAETTDLTPFFTEQFLARR